MERRQQTQEEEYNKLVIMVETMRWGGDFDLHGEVVVDAVTGLVQSWSPAATSMLDWNSMDMQGQPLTRIIPERFHEKHLEAMRRLVQSGSVPKSGPWELIALKKDGTEVCIQATYAGWHHTRTGAYQVGAIIRRWTRAKPDSNKRNPSQAQASTRPT